MLIFLWATLWRCFVWIGAWKLIIACVTCIRNLRPDFEFTSLLMLGMGLDFSAMGCTDNDAVTDNAGQNGISDTR